MSCEELLDLFKDQLFDPTEYVTWNWREAFGDVYYNELSVEDLLEEKGETYSGRVRSRLERDGYVLFLLDDGGAGDFQAIFDLNKQVKDD